jgi:hypothetical protein
MSDIFIAYSRSDSAVACELAERLRAKGWSFFMDVRTPVGERWDKKIEKELHAARAVVVLWSARSRESDFVLEEAEYGRRKEILSPRSSSRWNFPMDLAGSRRRSWSDGRGRTIPAWRSCWSR